MPLRKQLQKTKHLYGAAHHSLQYKRALRETRHIQKTKPLLLVLHLFYPEMWNDYKTQIVRLKQFVDLDVCITVPRFKRSQVQGHDFGASRVFFVPNRGRDVLPFLRVLDVIDLDCYKYILKLHSKKSPQRSAGSDWTTEILNSLLPDDKTLHKVLQTLENTDCGIIGPQGNYLPLPLYLTDNQTGVMYALSQIFGASVAKRVRSRQDAYGFFAGTMFWMSVDIASVLKKHSFQTRLFVSEQGQLDGTFAHAMERVFSLVAEILKKDVYESGPHTLRKITYKSKISQEAWDTRAANKEQWKGL